MAIVVIVLFRSNYTYFEKNRGLSNQRTDPETDTPIGRQIGCFIWLPLLMV